MLVSGKVPVSLLLMLGSMLSLAVQGLSHKTEAVLPEPFNGLVDLCGEFSANSLMVSGLFVLSGSWLRGDTGASSEPHLHFEVLECEGEPIVYLPEPSFNSTCHSLPVTLRNTRPHPKGLVEGAILYRGAGVLMGAPTPTHSARAWSDPCSPRSLESFIKIP